MEHNSENNTEQFKSINTFVMFDTETTGLPSPGNNPRITELCFIALTRDELLTQQSASRVLNKLLICFNPCKNICHKSSELTGLYNDALESLAPFRKQAVLISLFLRNLPQPACVIAHNGNGFDFPLLVSHLKYANEEVPEGILCADSLEAFRMFDDLPPVPEFVLQKRKANITCTQPPTKRIYDKKSSDLINEAPENKYSENKTTEACENKPKQEGDQKFQINRSDVLKRFADSGSLLSHDMKSKEAKLSVQQTEVWYNGEHTPDKATLGIIASYRPQPVPHFDIGQYEKRGEVKRHLFESDNFEKREHTQYHVSSLQSNSAENVVDNKEGVDYYPNFPENCSIPEKSEDVGESSVTGASVVNSLDSERNPSQLYKSKKTFDNPSKNSGEVILSWSNAVSDKIICNRMDPNLNICISSHLTENDCHKSTSEERQLSYSLSNIYFRVFGQKPEVAHTAEDDCQTLLKIIRNKMNRFATWCDKHAVPLKSIHPMY